MVHLGKTPKEKANEMIDSFKATLVIINSDISSDEISLTSVAKLCAVNAIKFIEANDDNRLFWLETVDEIVKA